MTEEEKQAAEKVAEEAKEKEEVEFQTSLEGLSEEDKTKKLAERETQKEGEDKKPETSPEKKADELLKGDEKRILVDKDRFNDRNDKAKLYEAFAPIIDKVKDNPDLVNKLLDTDKKGTLEDRVAQMETDKKSEKQREYKEAVTDALSKWSTFEKDWPELRDQVEMLVKNNGLKVKDAIRRSFLALHPEEAQAESKRMASENANTLGEFKSGGSQVPKPEGQEEETNLNEREVKVAESLIGKDFGGGFVPIKSKADYAKLLEKHKDHMKATGFYDSNLL